MPTESFIVHPQARVHLPDLASAPYGYDTLRLLIRVWMLAGQPAGKYLAATMTLWLPKLEQHGESARTRTGSPITPARSC